MPLYGADSFLGWMDNWRRVAAKNVKDLIEDPSNALSKTLHASVDTIDQTMRDPMNFVGVGIIKRVPFNEAKLLSSLSKHGNSIKNLLYKDISESLLKEVEIARRFASTETGPIKSARTYGDYRSVMPPDFPGVYNASRTKQSLLDFHTHPGDVTTLGILSPEDAIRFMQDTALYDWTKKNPRLSNPRAEQVVTKVDSASPEYMWLKARESIPMAQIYGVNEKTSEDLLARLLYAAKKDRIDLQHNISSDTFEALAVKELK